MGLRECRERVHSILPPSVKFLHFHYNEPSAGNLVVAHAGCQAYAATKTGTVYIQTVHYSHLSSLSLSLSLFFFFLAPPRSERINPLSAPACTFSGLKDAQTRLQTVYFQSYNTSTLSGMRFDENPFMCLCGKEDKKAEGFQISHFYGSFSVTSWQ